MAPSQGERAKDTPGDTARRLMRGVDRAALGTGDAGWPYVSLVLTGTDHDASPVLLLSDLAVHSRNIAADDRAALLFHGSEAEDPLTAPRVRVQGRDRKSTSMNSSH